MLDSQTERARIVCELGVAKKAQAKAQEELKKV